MIQQPAVIALLISALTVAAITLYASWYGIKILLGWDIGSGSERQMELERRTYLISSIISYALAFQILSLFLYIYTADELHGLFTGAMCAAGTLHANGYGYPTLILKIIDCILAGVWLIVNFADTRGYDYPLIRFKYGLLAIIAPLAAAEAGVEYLYFSGLKGDIITSCCGSLFGTDKPGLAGDIVSLPPGLMEKAFFGCMALVAALGLVFWIWGRGGYIFSAVCGLSFFVASASLISFISLYIYELPSHHCPFCILQREYAYVGYALYASLLCGVIAGVGLGALMPFLDRASMRKVVPKIQRGLAAVAVVMYMIFTAIVAYKMVFTSFRLV